jgi:GntR family transcriptional regulator/MocR family aminotransferase
MPAPEIALNRQGTVPLFRQIYQRYRQLIAQGLLRPGERVPSLRSLAGELGISRGTVESAYDLLIGEGYLVSRGPGGTRVAAMAHAAPDGAPVLVVPTAGTRQGKPALLRPGLPALDAFPFKVWSRLAVRQQRSLPPSRLDYPGPAGYGPLRAAIAAYLQRARGIACAPEQVFVCAGYRAVLALVCRALLRPQDLAWVENPGYPMALETLRQAGARLHPVPVDGAGLCVEVGLRQAAEARFALVTPSHQSPLGVSMSLARRLQLLDWARAAGSWIIEDDYDGEYRYQGAPLPALQSLDRAGRVLYAGTFSKVVFPGLRLAYLVAPAAQVDRFVRAAGPRGDCPELNQAILSDFIEQGHFARHVKKMRSLYAQRRGFLARALAAQAGALFSVELQAGGMHLLARLPDGADDQALAARARAQGFGVAALSSWHTQGGGAGLIMGFANIDSQSSADQLVRRLLLCWRA